MECIIIAVGLDWVGNQITIMGLHILTMVAHMVIIMMANSIINTIIRIPSLYYLVVAINIMHLEDIMHWLKDIIDLLGKMDIIVWVMFIRDINLLILFPITIIVAD